MAETLFLSLYVHVHFLTNAFSCCYYISEFSFSVREAFTSEIRSTNWRSLFRLFVMVRILTVPNIHLTVYLTLQ